MAEEREENCNQNNDILVRAEIRRSGEDRRAVALWSPGSLQITLGSALLPSQSQIWKYPT